MTGYQSKRAAAQDKLAQPAQEQVSGTREAFEKWAKTLPNYMDITRFEDGYSDCNTDYAWAAWQAALAQRPWVGLTEQQQTDIEDAAEMMIGIVAFSLISDTLKANNT